MTRERIEDMREVVLPFVKKRLLETNYENLGESDAEEFAKEFNEILDLAIKALEQEPCENNICDSCHTKGCIFQSGIKRVSCEFYTAQNEPCNDAISRESLLNKLCGYHVDIEKSIFDKLWRVIKDMPPVTPQEPKTGHWREDIDNNRRWDRVRFYCSECGNWQTYGKTDYCPNCGAKMFEPQESEG